MQRCPAVPTAPKTVPIMVVFIFADGVTMMALFPPNSSSDFPKRAATVCATLRPMRVEPVAESKGMR